MESWRNINKIQSSFIEFLSGRVITFINPVYQRFSSLKLNLLFTFLIVLQLSTLKFATYIIVL